MRVSTWLLGMQDVIVKFSPIWRQTAFPSLYCCPEWICCIGKKSWFHATFSTSEILHLETPNILRDFLSCTPLSPARAVHKRAVSCSPFLFDDFICQTAGGKKDVFVDFCWTVVIHAAHSFSGCLAQWWPIEFGVADISKVENSFHYFNKSFSILHKRAMWTESKAEIKPTLPPSTTTKNR